MTDLPCKEGRGDRRNVVENEGDPILGALVYYAVLFLVVYLVCLPDFELVRSAVDREPDSWIRRNWHMDTVRNMKRLVNVTMRFDILAGPEPGRYRTNDLAAGRIVFLDNFLHDRHSDFRYARPPGSLAHLAIRPFRIVQGKQHDRPGLIVHIE